MKTKKIKIIAIILSTVALITACWVALSVNTISHCMKLNAPSRIIVYYNSEFNNKVFEQGDNQYDQIYSSIRKAYTQPLLKAMSSKRLFKDVQICSCDSTNISFDNIKINFVYDTPQVVKYKTKSYLNNGENYWYKSLIFDIVQIDNYQLNTVAIIPPENDVNYISPYSYELYYRAYSNFNNTYAIANLLFN